MGDLGFSFLINKLLRLSVAKMFLVLQKVKQKENDQSEQHKEAGSSLPLNQDSPAATTVPTVASML